MTDAAPPGPPVPPTPPAPNGGPETGLRSEPRKPLKIFLLIRIVADGALGVGLLTSIGSRSTTEGVAFEDSDST